MTYPAFRKIPRFHRTVKITEKIDGSNGQICILPGNAVLPDMDGVPAVAEIEGGEFYWEVFAGSRKRWITPEADNFGFAQWVKDNAQALVDTLGEGHHFGEWWGQGIQRNYGLKERRFSLFNTSRWSDPYEAELLNNVPGLGVVPLLGTVNAIGINQAVDDILSGLREAGSVAEPGWMNPEGVILYHEAGNHLFKVTLVDDFSHKELGLHLDLPRLSEVQQGDVW